MEKLTDRQVELIKDLLETYEFCYKHSRETGYICFHFNGKIYTISAMDYNKVCEIIDYIKGVKK